MEVLERISGFTAEEAKAYLINQLEAEVTHESAMKIREIEASSRKRPTPEPKKSCPLPFNAAQLTTWQRPLCRLFPCPMTR